MIKFWKNKWFKFALAGGFYLFWVIWMNSYLWLLGLPIIFDIYITKRVHWAFWKKKGVKKQKKVIEWIDALIFAVIAASFIRMFFIEAFTIPTSSMEKTMRVGDYLFVSKYHYGPRKPITPISFPFVHHTMPLSTYTKSYSTAIQWEYDRMPGLTDLKRNDIVVFNFPEGDTVIIDYQNQSYYQIIRNEANAMMNSDRMKGVIKPYNFYANKVRNMLLSQYEWHVRPLDKRENYIKRCVAVAGDNIEIKDGIMFVNGERQTHFEDMQFKYFIYTKGQAINSKILQEMEISKEDQAQSMIQRGVYILPLTKKMVDKIRSFKIVDSVVRKIDRGDHSDYIFPHDSRYQWTQDNFGPLYIPKAGETVTLSMDNISIYKRLIDLYEHNDLSIKNNKIFINGKETTTYTIKQNYYWMMGDSRHSSQDSRFWGFVPEDHIVGKPLFIWLSLDKDETLFNKIRWSRMFRSVK